MGGTFFMEVLVETVLLPRCCQESCEAGNGLKRKVFAFHGKGKLRSVLAFVFLFAVSSKLGCTYSFNHLLALRDSMRMQKVPLGLIYTAPRYHTTRPHLGALVQIEPGAELAGGETTPVDDAFTMFTAEDDSIMRNTLTALAPVALVEVALLAVIAARMHGLRWPGGSSHDVAKQPADNTAQIATTSV